MFDINAVINSAITEAVQASLAQVKQEHLNAIGALAHEITQLQTRADAAEAQLMAARDRISALEDQAIVTNDRISANLFTQMTPATITADAFVTHLDQQEWFWHKVAGFVTNNSEITSNDLEGMKERVSALEDRTNELESETQGENRYLNREDVNSLIEEAIDEHCSTYDHDDYDSHVNDDDKHVDGDIEDAVRDALSNMTFDVTIR